MATLIVAIELSGHFLVVLIGLEDFVGSKDGDSVGMDYPNIAIASNKITARLKELGTSQGLLSDSLPVIKDRMENIMEQRNQDK
eukprot:11650386-Ditylum_brightwellii.AAC.1